MKKRIIALALVFLAGITFGQEDYTTYTETDAASDITIIGTDSISVSTMARDADSRVFKGFGENYFNSDFSHELAFSHNSASTFLSLVFPWTIGNVKGTWDATDTASEDAIGVYVYNGTPKEIGFRELDGGNTYTAISDFAWSSNTNYWIRVWYDKDKSTFGTIYLEVYSDQSRTTQLNTTTEFELHHTLDDSLLFAFQSFGTGSPDWTGSIFELNLDGQAGTPPAIEALDPLSLSDHTPYRYWNADSLSFTDGDSIISTDTWADLINSGTNWRPADTLVFEDNVLGSSHSSLNTKGGDTGYIYKVTQETNDTDFTNDDYAQLIVFYHETDTSYTQSLTRNNLRLTGDGGITLDINSDNQIVVTSYQSGGSQEWSETISDPDTVSVGNWHYIYEEYIEPTSHKLWLDGELIGTWSHTNTSGGNSTYHIFQGSRQFFTADGYPEDSDILHFRGYISLWAGWIPDGSGIPNATERTNTFQWLYENRGLGSDQNPSSPVRGIRRRYLRRIHVDR